MESCVSSAHIIPYCEAGDLLRQRPPGLARRHAIQEAAATVELRRDVRRRDPLDGMGADATAADDYPMSWRPARATRTVSSARCRYRTPQGADRKLSVSFSTRACVSSTPTAMPSNAARRTRSSASRFAPPAASPASHKVLSASAFLLWADFAEGNGVEAWSERKRGFARSSKCEQQDDGDEKKAREELDGRREARLALKHRAQAAFSHGTGGCALHSRRFSY